MRTGEPLGSVTIHEGGGPIFHLQTSSCSMVLRVGPAGHLEQVWWGSRLGDAPWEELDALHASEARVISHIPQHGASAESSYSLGHTPLAWSTGGKGDFRAPALRIADQQVLDLVYRSHRVVAGAIPVQDLPTAQGDPCSETLEVTLGDPVVGVEVVLRWTTFPASGAITRRALVRNVGPSAIVVDQAASMLVDLAAPAVDLVTVNCHWASDGHAERLPLGRRQTVIESLSGLSSTRYQPGFLLVESSADEHAGQCWGVNLVYSGNHWSSVEADVSGLVRIVTGINPSGFAWPLAPGEEFVTPEAVLAYSSAGLNGVSGAFHRFVDEAIVPPHWRRTPRPVVLNSWEGSGFQFTADSLVEMAGLAADMGVETFVLDDGWFGRRNDDRRSLGDWHENLAKLPGGLEGLAGRLRSLGLGFGLWFEPEAVSPDSDLFRAHPDWAVRADGRTPSEGRHELVLDLTRADVRDHLVAVVGDIIDRAGITFVKWDFNRPITDASAANFHHRYVLGLYDVLRRIFGPRPEVLLENCSSGGGRFDLGMLAFGPQTWASDCTDPVERLVIQRSLSLLYPASAISAHVSPSPNHQSGRDYTVDFRFGVSAPCVFGVELDPRTMSEQDRRELGERIAWYRRHRRLLQFGEHRWGSGPQHLPQLAVTDGTLTVAFSYCTNPRPLEALPPLAIPGLAGDTARIAWPFTASPERRLPTAALRAGWHRTGRARDVTCEIAEIETRTR